jgi:hypothetical protein
MLRKQWDYAPVMWQFSKLDSRGYCVVHSDGYLVVHSVPEDGNISTLINEYGPVVKKEQLNLFPDRETAEAFACKLSAQGEKGEEWDVYDVAKVEGFTCFIVGPRFRGGRKF